MLLSKTKIDNFDYRERGFVGLYKGAQVNFGRALLSWGIVNAVYELLGNILPSYSVCF